MSKPRGWKPTLRYSPVNGIIVDWGINGQPFNMCGMPSRSCEAPAPEPEAPGCDSCEPIVEPVPTYDWYRWVPEIIVGVSSANEDMAASYARSAAIKFATQARVLRRQVAITLQPNIFRYPIEVFEDERVIGVASIDSDSGSCACNGGDGVFVGEVQIDQPRQEVLITPAARACGCHVGRSGPKHLLVTVWATPTEDSCKHDAFLYERYRAEITGGARGAFLAEGHAYGAYKTNRGYASARGDALMFQRADMLASKFDRDIRRARAEAETGNAISNEPPPSMWATGCCNGARR